MSDRIWLQWLAGVVRRLPWTVRLGRALWQRVRPTFSVGVVGLIYNTSGQILMVEHVFHPYRPWGLPGGWVERHEDPRESLRRELREELALEVEVGPVLAVENRDGNHLDLAFLCTARGEIGPLSRELLGYRWFSPDRLPPTHEFHLTAVQAAQTYLSLASRV